MPEKHIDPIWSIKWHSPIMPASAFDYRPRTCQEAFESALGYASRGGVIAQVQFKGEPLITFGNGGCVVRAALAEKFR